MRIDNHSYVDQLAYAQQAKDPFDLDFKVSDLQAKHNEMAPITSVSLCTPGCTNGTGNSFCCTCK